MRVKFGVYPEFPVSTFFHEENYLSVVWLITLEDFYSGAGDLSILFASQPSIAEFLLLREVISAKNMIDQVKKIGPKNCLFVPCAADMTPLKMHENIAIAAFLKLPTIPTLVAKRQLTSVKFGEEWLDRFSEAQKNRIKQVLSTCNTDSKEV